jgi:hypothetical protein
MREKLSYSLAPVGRLSDNSHIWLIVDDAGKPLSDNRVIVSDQDGERHGRYPLSGGYFQQLTNKAWLSVKSK